jgi:hypothetical protein
MSNSAWGIRWVTSNIICEEDSPVLDAIRFFIGEVNYAGIAFFEVSAIIGDADIVGACIRAGETELLKPIFEYIMDVPLEARLTWDVCNMIHVDTLKKVLPKTWNKGKIAQYFVEVSKSYEEFEANMVKFCETQDSIPHNYYTKFARKAEANDEHIELNKKKDKYFSAFFSKYPKYIIQ